LSKETLKAEPKMARLSFLRLAEVTVLAAKLSANLFHSAAG
ncbi:unnamed protein product, partial [marine sediment metagenome]